MKERKISYKLVGKDVMSISISVGRGMASLAKTRKQIFLKRSQPYYGVITVVRENGQERISKKLFA